MAGSAELVDLAETVGAETVGVFMGFLDVKPEIFRTFLEKFRKDF